MTDKDSLNKIKSEIQKGMRLAKCKKCGCMKDMLTNLSASLSSIEGKEEFELSQNVSGWLKEMEPIEYTCLGCKYCFPAVVANLLTTNFPDLTSSSLSCGFEVKEEKWPPVAGEYFAFCEGVTCPVAVSTLASIELAESLAKMRPKGLCIIGKTETENIGIDKIIKNIVTNPTIRFLIIAGQDSEGHHSGETLLALSENGVDSNMKVIGAHGKRPILRNVTLSEVESFRKQVKVINMIGCQDSKTIIDKIDELSKEDVSICEWKECSDIKVAAIPKIQASESRKLKMDKTGYFVVIPSSEKKIIVVEHYSYDNKLLHIIEGKESPAIYSTIVGNGWITELSHAAYLGRELAKAELSMKYGFKYIQDKALGRNETSNED